jgi:hypothetical protein
MDQWLTTCVSIERTFIIIKGIHFNKKKTKSIAKWIIFGLVLFIISTTIHDPIYRSLFIENNNEQKRIWCIVEYSYAIQIFNSIMNISHFIPPFFINVISAVLIIIISTRKQAKVRTQQTYKQILNEQIQKHRSLLIGPFVLIILGIPRLIISLASGCMKSTNDSWLFILGYYISLIPPLLTFIIFILPSTVYKQEFDKAINQYKSIFKRLL